MATVTVPSRLLLRHLRSQLGVKSRTCQGLQQRHYSEPHFPARAHGDRRNQPQSQGGGYNPFGQQNRQRPSPPPGYTQDRYNQSPNQRYPDRYTPTQHQNGQSRPAQYGATRDARPQQYGNVASPAPPYSTSPPRQPQAYQPFSSPEQLDAQPQRPARVSGNSTIKKPAVKDVLAREFVIDEYIGSRIVIPKSPEGKLEAQTTLFSLLNSIDRESQCVIQRNKPNPDDPADLPIVEVVTKQSLRKQLESREEAKAAQARSMRDSKPKQIELNWAISEHDLALKMKQMAGFVEKGKKVELMLAAKKRQRRATLEEANALVKQIKASVAEIEGARLNMEGRIGMQALIVVQKDKGPAKTKKKGSENAHPDNSDE